MTARDGPQIESEVKTLVRRIDHDRVFAEAALLQVGHQTPDALVGSPNGPQVVLHVALILPAHEFLALEPQGKKARVLLPERLVPPRALRAGHLLEIAKSR